MKLNRTIMTVLIALLPTMALAQTSSKSSTPPAPEVTMWQMQIQTKGGNIVMAKTAARTSSEAVDIFKGMYPDAKTYGACSKSP